MKYINNLYLPLKKRVYLYLQHVLQRYDGRKSNYTKTGKIALCCIAKMENDYIRFFVEYYNYYNHNCNNILTNLFDNWILNRVDGVINSITNNLNNYIIITK